MAAIISGEFSRGYTETVTDRMPAVLAAEDWATWLGETDASSDQVKAVLKTVEGVDWRMAKEEKPPKR